MPLETYAAIASYNLTDGYVLDVKVSRQQRSRMSLDKKLTSVRVFVIPQVRRDFAGVRGRVITAIKASPQSVTLSNALTQVRLFRKAA